MNGRAVLSFGIVLSVLPLGGYASEPLKLDRVSAEQAELEKSLLAADQPRTHTEAMAEYRKTAEVVRYPSGERQLPGYLYRPAGAGPHPAVLWNHGSEKDPKAQPELARFYTEHGFVFFAPIRHGHGNTEGPYIVDLQKAIAEKEPDFSVARSQQVKLHDVYNEDVVAAVAWLKQQPFVDPDRIVVSGCSYGGIQTLLTAEKGLGVRGFIAFAPGAMSFANLALRDRMKAAATNTKAPLMLLQAQNDYSVGPSELLGPILKDRGSPSHSTVYPAFGKTNQHGHGAFATWSLGTAQWGAEALEFIAAVLDDAKITWPYVREEVSPLEELTVECPTGFRAPVIVRRPPGEGPFPLVVVLHGGLVTRPIDELKRWATQEHNVSRLLAAGYAIAVPTYSDRKEDPQTTAALLDCVRVIDQVHRLPKMDSRSVFVFGGSGGGSLALELAGETRLAAIVAGEPASVLFTGVMTKESSPELQAIMADPLKYCDNERVRAFTRAKIDKIGCPTLIVHSDVHAINKINDVFVLPMMKEAGKTPEVHSVVGAEHGFYFSSAARADATLAAFQTIESFLRKHSRTAPRAIDPQGLEQRPVTTGRRAPATGGN